MMISRTLRHRSLGLILMLGTSVAAGCSDDSGTGPRPVWQGRWTDTTEGVRVVLRMAGDEGDDITCTRLSDGLAERYLVLNVLRRTDFYVFELRTPEGSEGEPGPTRGEGYLDVDGAEATMFVEPLGSSVVQGEERTYVLTRQSADAFAVP